MIKSNDSFKAYAAYIAVCIFWGTTYMAIKIGVSELPPVLFAGLRQLSAGIIFFVILKSRGYKLPNKEDLIHLAVVGIALLGFGNALVVFSEQYIPSSLAALLITTVPFWIVGLESLLPKGTRLNLTVLAGLLMGLTGVFLIFGNNAGGIFNPEYLTGIISMFCAVLAWSFGTLYSKHKKISVHPLMGAAFQMIIAGIGLTIFGTFLGEFSVFHFTTNSFLAFTYLLIFGSIVGYGSYIYALSHLPVSLVSTYAYVNPVIALFLGWFFLNEEITITIIIAAAIILAGVAVVKKGSNMQKLNLRGVE